jgi:hypothetical protein
MKATLLAALVIALSASVASADPAGNNGTVKVHSGTGETEPWVDVMNQPHVTCPFHMHFFFADGGQTGMWWIVSDDGVNTTGDTYTADANGMATTGAVFMPAGHYSLSWQGSTEDLAKHKTFWAEGECSGGPGG